MTSLAEKEQAESQGRESPRKSDDSTFTSEIQKHERMLPEVSALE
jgi:hypothetical protein